MNSVVSEAGGMEGAPGALSGTPFALAPGSGPVNAVREFDESGILVGLGETNDLSASLLALLEALAWQGNPQQVAEALPHFVENFDITSFRNVLGALGFTSHSLVMGLHDIGPEQTPCLFLPKGQCAMVLVGMMSERTGDQGERFYLEAFDSARGHYIELPEENMKGTAYVFSRAATGLLAKGHGVTNWFREVGQRFRNQAWQSLGLTLVLNLLGLAVPLFAMAVFDNAIASGSARTLTYLALGVGMAIVAEIVLRSLRAGLFSFVGARLDNIVGVEVFRKILYLPASLIERAAIGAQVSRIRNFETDREFMTGQAALALIEVPFALIFIAVIAYLGGALALAPVLILVASVGLGKAVKTKAGELVDRASRAARVKQELMVETLSGMRAIKYCGADGLWLERYRALSGKAALYNFFAAQFSSFLEILAYVALIASGFVTVVLGVAKVGAGEMTLGAVVACLLLVWRSLQPLQTGLASLPRINGLETGIKNLNNLMEIESGHSPVVVPGLDKRAEGQVTFENVSVRYEAGSPPALHDASFNIKGGKIVAVLGSNGAGKTTLLKLMAGLYGPDEGSVSIDGRNVEDMTRAELRNAVSYVPQEPRFFYGTIAQNLRLANPTASNDDLRWALRQAGALEDIEAMEQGSGEWKRTGFDVRLGDKGAGQVSPGLLQRLNLARGYLKRAPIVLLDEPGNGLDMKGDQALMQAISNMRGETTVFIVTHRPSHLKMADRVIWMEYGSIRSVGRPKVVMQKTRGKVL